MLLEPMRRDFWAGAAAGAAFAEARDKDAAIVLVLAADHVVSDTPAFLSAACREGLAAAEAGHIVTFGVQPERAATQMATSIPARLFPARSWAVAKFVEKPDPARCGLCRGRLSLEQRQLLHVLRRRADG